MWIVSELYVWGLWALEAGLIVAITMGGFLGLCLAGWALCVVVVLVKEACLAVCRPFTTDVEEKP